MTLNGVMALILHYFSEFDSYRGALRKSSRSLSHLLMSSCTNGRPKGICSMPLPHSLHYAVKLETLNLIIKG